uniref:Uncharacterized protein n=1 Tax=Anguilla anguilla TaxID=7936 RepID=A0A0E9U795_ANGAN
MAPHSCLHTPHTLHPMIITTEDTHHLDNVTRKSDREENKQDRAMIGQGQ